MGLPQLNASPELALLGGLVLVPFVVAALREVRHGFLPTEGVQHAWLAAIVAVAFLWSLSFRLADGLGAGLLGAPLVALMFGRARAVLALLTALALHLGLTDGDWWSFGLYGLLLAVLPSALTAALQGAVARWLPKNVFVFIIGNGMFVTLGVAAVTGMSMQLLTAALHAGALHNLPDHLLYTLLLAWGEGLLTGMFFSALVIYQPALVLTYDQDVYLPRRRGA